MHRVVINEQFSWRTRGSHTDFHEGTNQRVVGDGKWPYSSLKNSKSRAPFSSCKRTGFHVSVGR